MPNEPKKFTIFEASEYAWNAGGVMDVWGVDVTDSHHTMSELYEHRYALFCALCNLVSCHPEDLCDTWKSKLHNDGTMYEGWFIAGIRLPPKGMDISYHLPLEWWDKFKISELERAPEWDGYNSKDVIERLLKL